MRDRTRQAEQGYFRFDSSRDAQLREEIHRERSPYPVSANGYPMHAADDVAFMRGVVATSAALALAIVGSTVAAVAHLARR